MHLKLRLLLFLLSAIVAHAQVGTWEKLPTLTEIRSLLPLKNQILMASNGGLLLFDKSSQTFTYGINDQETENLDVITTLIDSDSLLWIGSRSPGPIVEVIDLKNHKYLDVEFVDLDEANSFVEVGDSVYATYQDGLEGGLLLYRKGSSSIEYLDLFNNFPNQSSMDMDFAGDVSRSGDKLIFRTNYEILWAELDGRNLKDPVNWEVARVPSGDDQITSMIALDSLVLVAAGRSIYSYDFISFSKTYTSDSNIEDMEPDPAREKGIILTNADGIYALEDQDGTASLLLSIAGVENFELYEDELWITSPVDFLSLYHGQVYESYSANRPRDHLFNRMAVDQDGQLVGGATSGISLFSHSGWRTIIGGSSHGSFNEDSYDWDSMITDTLEFRGDAVVEDMLRDGQGNIFLTLQGRGVLKLDEDQPGRSRFFTPQNSDLEPTFNSNTYILPIQMAVDSQGNVWVTTKYGRTGGHVISIITPEDSVYHIDQFQDGLDSRSIKSIAIDASDRVWLGSQVNPDMSPPTAGGLHFIEVLDDEISNQMNLNVSSLSQLTSPLPSNEILQLEVDAHQTLWILTPSGVQSMTVPDQWLNNTELRNHASLYMTPKENDFYYYWQLTDYNVTGIEIDQRGNRWFLSANAGVHVLLENGRWINGGYGYNTGNSGLLDNEIFSAAFDAESGQTYLSTTKGVSILNTPFANPKETYSNVHIYPQPFNPDIHEKVIIQGLMDNSSVKILTVSGVLVKELTFLDDDVQGYEAQWDGRDKAGDKVGSGVYILYLYNEDGAASSQKLAILR